MTLKVGIFTGLLQYFPRNTAILVKKNWREKKSCQNPFPAILRPKNPNAIKVGEGGG